MEEVGPEWEVGSRRTVGVWLVKMRKGCVFRVKVKLIKRLQHNEK